MSGLIDGSWVLISASTFSLLQYVVLVDVEKENLAFPRYGVEKEENSGSLFRCCGHSSLILHQTLTCGRFWNLKIFSCLILLHSNPLVYLAL